MLSTSVYESDGLEMLPLHEAAREGAMSRESFFDEVMLSMLWNRGMDESAGECDESNILTAGSVLATTEERSPLLEVSWMLCVAFSAISEFAVNDAGTKKLAPLIGLKDCLTGSKSEPELVAVPTPLLNVSTYLGKMLQIIPVRKRLNIMLRVLMIVQMSKVAKSKIIILYNKMWEVDPQLLES